MNKVFNKSCESMTELDDNSVDLIVTSPPYHNLKDYSSWNSYDDYLNWLRNIFKECFRVLHPGSWICWNIQECIPKEKADERLGCHPLLAHTIGIMEQTGFLYEKDIIWYKGKGTATQKLFGSFPKPSLILVSGLTEHIITARKPFKGTKRKQRSQEIVDKSLISKKQWGEWATDMWEIKPVPSKLTNHPAPFPIELAERCIRLNSFVEDLVLDPFMGSGTTAVAAVRSKRNYVGYEIHKKYVNMIEAKLNKHKDLFDE